MQAKLNSNRAAPIDNYTKLLLHLDNNVNDVVGNTVTNNSVTFSTTRQLGSHSAVFNGTNSYLSIADSADFTYGTGDFTIEFWVNFANGAGPQYFYNHVGGGRQVQIYQAGQDARPIFYVHDNGTEVAIYQFPTLTDLYTGWHHLAIVRSGTNILGFYDGVSQSMTVINAIGTQSINDPSGALILGSYNTTNNFFNGYLDEFRISKGIARWTSTFTPPPLPYGSDLPGKINFPGFQEIADFISDGTESSFSLAVDGDTDKEYKIEIRSGGAEWICMRLNNDAKSGNYGRQYLQNSGGSITAARLANETYMYLGGGAGSGQASLLTPVGFPKTVFDSFIYNVSGTTVGNFSIQGWTYTPTANVVSLDFMPDTNVNFSAGTRITVYARRSN
jgi:hypothetical protein